MLTIHTDAFTCSQYTLTSFVMLTMHSDVILMLTVHSDVIHMLTMHSDVICYAHNVQ